VVQDAGGEDDVERAWCEAWPLQVGLDEEHAIESKVTSGCRPEQECGTRQVGRDHETVGAREE
jgi:hypothetical protein